MRDNTKADRLIRAARSPTQRAAGFVASNGGVAAVEFAMILPLMLMIYFGMVDVTAGVNIDRKVTLLSRTLADLTGRSTTVTDEIRDNIFNAAVSVLAPYNASDVKMRISSIVIRKTDTRVAPTRGEVCWSEARGGMSQLKAGDPYSPLPAGFLPQPDSQGVYATSSTFILAEVELPYIPITGYVIKSSINLGETTPWPVRNASEVLRTGVLRCI